MVLSLPLVVKVVVICTVLGHYINLYTFLLLVDIIIEGNFCFSVGNVVNQLERLFMVDGFSIVCDLE